MVGADQDKSRRVVVTGCRAVVMDDGERHAQASGGGGKPGHAGGRAFLREQRDALGPWTSSEKRAGLLALTAVLLWATDFVHHINPAVIGLGVGLAAICPGSA